MNNAPDLSEAENLQVLLGAIKINDGYRACHNIIDALSPKAAAVRFNDGMADPDACPAYWFGFAQRLAGEAS